MAYLKNVNVDPESWDPAFLFTTPPEEKEEEEEIDEGNVQIGPTALAPGTVTPTENNIETNVTAGNTNVTTISAGDADPEGEAALQRQLLNIAKMSEQVENTTSNEYFDPEQNEAARDFLTFIGKGLESTKVVGELAEAAYIEEEIKTQAKRDAADQIELNLPNGEPFDFTNQEQVDKFVQKTFDDLFKKDKEIAQIQRTILDENKELIAAKEEELKNALSKYTTYVFPENYFSSLSRPFLGVDIESPEMTFTPDQEKMEQEIQLLNQQYADYVNDLILTDPRFIDRIGYIEGGIASSLNPLIEEAKKRQAINNIRLDRQKAELFGAERGSIDDLGFGVNSVALVQFMSGSDPDSRMRNVEKLLGYEQYELSDTIVQGLEMLSLDKQNQSLIMNEFQKDYKELEKMYSGEDNKQGVNYLPEGENSWIWVNTKGTDKGQRGHQRAEFNWFPAVFNKDTNGKIIYNHPATALGSTTHPTNNKANKYAREQGWELMKWKDAEQLIIQNLDQKQKFILDRHIQLMDKEFEKGYFEQEQFTDFLGNILKGNVGDALRYLPKVVLKQVPYMAANWFSAGLYTMASEGGNIGFEIAANAAARELGVEPNDLTGQQILDWINNNEQAYDDALAKGLTAGGAIAGLERAGIGYMIKSSKFGIGAFSQLLKGNIKKALTQGRSMFSQNIKAGLNESFTEGAQTGVEQLTLGKFNAMEYVNAMGEGFLGGVILPGLGSITAATTQQVIELAQNTRLNLRDPELYNKAKIVFENGRKKLDNDYKDGVIDEKQYEERLQKLSNDRNTLLKIPTHFDVESKQETFKIIQEISNLKNELEQIGDNKGLGKPIVDDIVKLNERLAEIFTEQGLNKQIQGIELEVNEDGNVSMQTFETKTEADAFIDQVNQNGNWDSRASKDGSGTILQNKQTGEQLIIVNKETAAEVRDIAVADHEFLHALMFQTVKDNPGAATAIGKSLLGYLEKMDKNGQMTELFQERYKQYKGLPIEQQYEEALNFFADAIINEEIQVNDGIIEKLGRVIRNLLQKLPFVNINFKSNKDVYNFVKDYALRRRAGKRLNAAQRRMLTRKATVGKNLGKGTSSQIADMIENQGGNLNKAFAPQSKRTAQDLMLEYQQEGANMQAELVEDLVNQYYSLGLKAMGYSKEAGDVAVEDALNFLNTEFPSIARNYTEINSETGRPQSLSNYIKNTIGPRGSGFFKAEIEQKKRTVSKEKLEDKGRQIVDTDQQADFDQKTKGNKGRKKVFPNAVRVIADTITGETRAEQKAMLKNDIQEAILRVGTNPKAIAQYIVEKTKTKEYRALIKAKLGRFGSQQYTDNVFRLFNNKDFIKAIPVANIKRRFGKLFGIKQIDTVKTKKVEDGKTTYYDKQVYSIPAVTQNSLNKIRQYFLEGEKRSQSLFEIIGEGIAVESMQELKADKAFMKELQNRLEFKKSNLTASEFMDQVEFDLDKRNLEDKSFDVSKASNRKTKVKKYTQSEFERIGEVIRTMSTPRTWLNKMAGKKVMLPADKKTWTEKDYEIRDHNTLLALPLLGKGFFLNPSLEGNTRSIFSRRVKAKKGKPAIDELQDLFNSPLSADFLAENQEYLTRGLDQGWIEARDKEFFLVMDKIPEQGSIFTNKDIDVLRKAEKEQKAYQEWSKSKIKDKLTDPNFIAEQDAKDKVLKKIAIFIENQVWKDGEINYDTLGFWASWLTSQGDISDHPMRALSPIRFASTSNQPRRGIYDADTLKLLKGKEKEAGKEILNFVAEHAFQSSVAVKTILDLVINKKVKQNWNIIKDNFIQGQLLITDDNLVNLDYKTKLPIEFWKMENPNIWVRYLMGNPNINLNEYIISDGNKKNPGVITVAEYLGLPLDKNQINPDNIAFQNRLLLEILTDNKLTIDAKGEIKAVEDVNAKQSKRVKINKENLFDLINADGTTEASIEAMSRADKAIQEGNKLDKPTKGISVFDFDDTLAYSDSKVIVQLKDGTTQKITPAEFAANAERLLEDGAEFDFSEFNKVVNGRKGPLADLALKRQEKFGSGDIFVLTARPQASARSIKLFLEGIGLNLPLENITGLENGSPAAKALWIVDKAADGYNDFYFADDALPNVQAVKDVLDQIDVKSDVQIAKQSKRDRINKDFNIIIEQQSGKEWFKTYSQARAKVEGKKANRFEFFIPPSAEDFVGLLYKLLPSGKKGDMAFEWLKDHLINPYNKAEQAIIAAKITVANDFNSIRNSIDNIPTNLMDQAGYSNFTYSQALRVYIWNMQGMDIPGLSTRDRNALVKLIEKDPNMKVFAEKIAFIQKGRDYPAPMDNWVGGSITGDIINGIQKTFRKEALQEWQQNVDIIFSEENMYKLEALYGSNYIEALKNILGRMKRGSNRAVSESKQVENVMDWINNSVGTTMFLNRKTGILQLLSSVNFINWSDNNIVAAGKAFANQPQYWKDVVYLLNSDYLTQRRNGLKINVAESEIAEASKKGGLKGVIAYLLNKGFIFTRIADSLAIATGGATFYRNRVNSLQKQVNIDTGKLYTKAEAEAKAFDDFYKISEETQQSSQPDRISMQQASGLGRVVLNYANTPMQYARIIKRSTQDLLAGRGDWRTNVSRIIYYTLVQNMIFSALQAAVFTLLFDEEEEKDRTMSDKKADIGFGMLSTLLRGTGYGGALIDTIISMSREISIREDGLPSFSDDFAWNMFDFSPSIDTKVRKIRSIGKTFKYNRDQIKRRGFSLENPAYIAFGELVSAAVNVPLDRALRMAMTLKQASDKDTETWQKWALLIGYSSWSLNLPYWGTTTTIEREEKEDAEIEAKYKNDARKLKTQGYKRIPMTKGKPSGVLIEDYIEVTRPNGKIEYWLTPKK